MNVRTICLSILYDGEATGYEIRKLSVEGEYSYFVDASYGSIYPALAKLEADRLVTRRSRAAGRQAGQEDLRRSPSWAGASSSIRCSRSSAKTNIRSEFLLFARFASELPQSLVQERLTERVGIASTPQSPRWTELRLQPFATRRTHG